MPLTPEEQHDFEMLKPYFPAPQSAPNLGIRDPGIAQTPVGQLKTDDANVDIQKNLVTEANKTLDPTAASRKSMLENAQVNLDAANKIMLNPDGTVNNVAAFTGANNIPWTKGSQAHNALQNALAAQLRAETGAGSPASEIEEMAKRYMPSVWDSEAEQKQKLDNIQRLIGSTSYNMSPKLEQNKIKKESPKETEWNQTPSGVKYRVVQ